jgi:hypothetical protein
MKAILLSASLLIAALLTSQAQAKKEAKPKKTGNEWHAAGDAVTRSQKFADDLTKAFTLDQETRKKVYKLYLANTKPADEIRMGSGSENEKKKALKENQVAFDEKLKTILTRSQFQKYQKLGLII